MRSTYLLLLLACCARLFAQVNVADSIYLCMNYTKREVMIPMRDGVQLFTSIYTPKNASTAYPVLLKRTPYSCAPYGASAYPAAFQNRYLAQSGYIWVFQDVRGKYRSEAISWTSALSSRTKTGLDRSRKKGSRPGTFGPERWKQPSMKPASSKTRPFTSTAS